MGEYWKVVNKTKGEQLSPHKFGNGMKLGEWFDWDSQTKTKLVELCAGDWTGDEVWIVSDYDRAIHYHGAVTGAPEYYGDWSDWTVAMGDKPDDFASVRAAVFYRLFTSLGVPPELFTVDSNGLKVPGPGFYEYLQENGGFLGLGDLLARCAR